MNKLQAAAAIAEFIALNLGVVVGFESATQGATLHVGPTETYAQVQDAYAASASGDVIQVDPGTYATAVNQINGADSITVTHDLTINGSGGALTTIQAGPTLFSATVNKGIIVEGSYSHNAGTAPNLTVSNLTLTGAMDGAENGACIRYQTGNLIVNGVTCTNSQMGILAPPVVYNIATITVENSDFHAIGLDGCGAPEHELYIGNIASLIVQGSTFDDVSGGHLVKTRAFWNDIENNVINDTGCASYLVDFSEGGTDTLKNNILTKGTNAQTGTGVHFGGDHQFHLASSLNMTENLFINERTATSFMLVNQSREANVFECDNVAQGVSLTGVLQGPGEICNITQPNTAQPNAFLVAGPYPHGGNAYNGATNPYDFTGTTIPQNVTLTDVAGDFLVGGLGVLTVTETRGAFNNFYGGPGGMNLTFTGTAVGLPYIFTWPESDSTINVNDPVGAAVYSYGNDTIALPNLTTGTSSTFDVASEQGTLNVTGTLNGNAHVALYAVGTVNFTNAGTSLVEVFAEPGAAVNLTPTGAWELVEFSGATATVNDGVNAGTIYGWLGSAWGAGGQSAQGTRPIWIQTYDNPIGISTLTFTNGNWSVATDGTTTVDMTGDVTGTLITDADMDYQTARFGSGGGSFNVTNEGSLHLIMGAGNVTGTINPGTGPNVFEFDINSTGTLTAGVTTGLYRVGVDTLIMGAGVTITSQTTIGTGTKTLEVGFNTGGEVILPGNTAYQ